MDHPLNIIKILNIKKGKHLQPNVFVPLQLTDRSFRAFHGDRFIRERCIIPAYLNTLFLNFVQADGSDSTAQRK